MPPTPQAAQFVFAELWSPAQLELYICSFGPAGLLPAHLQDLAGHPGLAGLPFADFLGDMALRLLMAGHQRNAEQILQEMGILPSLAPLPPLEVTFYQLICSCSGLSSAYGSRHPWYVLQVCVPTCVRPSIIFYNRLRPITASVVSIPKIALPFRLTRSMGNFV